jgi:hypothetical protein
MPQSHTSGRPLRAVVESVCLAGVFAAGSAGAGVPAEFQGVWVPTKAACGSPLRMVVGADRLTLEQGSDRQELGGIEMAGPGYFPPDYRGVMAVLITEFDGHQPVTVTFNAAEKKGSALAEFSRPLQRNATPQMAAYNMRITTLKLAKRFALDKVALKKCAK